eukprot:TRINITY_DN6782_c0_g1_i1.p1 TRINITY_DN6782_c0_g1~~TRINITY_DN6782_c0_g1_i1.p1  ORF type:complete len:344 (+),score=15.67 TRINITY_DN6782_c0_g1_i1:54-1085(+)
MSVTIRIRFPEGQGVLKGIAPTLELEGLIAKSFEAMNVSLDVLECQQILTGFPPKAIDMTNTSMPIDSLGIKSGDTLIFKTGQKSANAEQTPSVSNSSMVFGQNTTSEASSKRLETESIQEPSASEIESSSNAAQPKRLKPNSSDIVLKRVVVPADNSCLFTSINYCMCGEVVPSEHTQFMREIIATTVADDTDKYSEAFLGKSNQKYCSWIKTKDAWGGAIEVQILADYFQVMIVVIDTQSVSMTKFGEFGNYEQMMLLIYDGIHYDPLCQISPSKKTVFPKSDQSVLDAAHDLGQTENKAHNFTDTTGFTLKCLVCGHKMKGQKEAQSHAMTTQHTNFSEV